MVVRSMMFGEPLSPEAARIPTAAARLFWDMNEIEQEVRDEISGGEAARLKEIMADTERTRHASAEFERTGFYPEYRTEQEIARDADRDRLVGDRLASDPEYQSFKVEMARLLEVGPDDIFPLDYMQHDHNDPRWLKASRLSNALREAAFERFRPGPEGGPRLRAVS